MTTPADARPSVIFPGEPGSFAEDAVILAFGATAVPTPVATFRDVVTTLEADGAPAGVLPIENVLFETRIRREMFSQTASVLLGSSQQRASGNAATSTPKPNDGKKIINGEVQ